MLLRPQASAPRNRYRYRPRSHRKHTPMASGGHERQAFRKDEILPSLPLLASRPSSRSHEGSGLSNTESDIKKSAKGAVIEKGIAIHGSSVDQEKDVLERWIQK